MVEYAKGMASIFTVMLHQETLAGVNMSERREQLEAILSAHQFKVWRHLLVVNNRQWVQLTSRERADKILDAAREANPTAILAGLSGYHSSITSYQYSTVESLPAIAFLPGQQNINDSQRSLVGFHLFGDGVADTLRAAIRSDQRSTVRRTMEQRYRSTRLTHLLTALLSFDSAGLPQSWATSLTVSELCDILIDRWAPLQKPHAKIRLADLLSAAQIARFEELSKEKTRTQFAIRGFSDYQKTTGMRSSPRQRAGQGSRLSFLNRLAGSTVKHSHPAGSARKEAKSKYLALARRLATETGPVPRCTYCSCALAYLMRRENAPRIDDWQLHTTNFSMDRTVPGSQGGQYERGEQRRRSLLGLSICQGQSRRSKAAALIIAHRAGESHIDGDEMLRPTIRYATAQSLAEQDVALLEDWVTRHIQGISSTVAHHPWK